MAELAAQVRFLSTQIGTTARPLAHHIRVAAYVNAVAQRIACRRSWCTQAEKARAELQLQQAEAQRRAEAVAAAVSEQRALEVRLAEAQSQLARAREEKAAQAAEVQQELAATRQQYEARLVEQQQRLLGEVAAKQEGLQALQAAVQVRLGWLCMCRLSGDMHCGA